MKKYDIFDLTKIVLCFMVVAIHTKLFPMVLYPWLRLAVPLFFIISSFLLASKIDNSSPSKKNDIIKAYVFRLLKYYLFWFVILLPITVYVRRDWFDNGVLIGLLNIIINPFISSTFLASWYISASIIGTLIVYKLCYKVNTIVLIVSFSFLYCLCCLSSSYGFLFDSFGFQNDNVFLSLFEKPYYSFLVSLIFVLFGKILYEKTIIGNNKFNIFLIISSSILLYFEWLFVYNNSSTYNNDCYFFVLPTAVLFFNYIKSVNVTVINSVKLRKFSNFVYPLHASVAICIEKTLEFFLSNDVVISIINFTFTLLICFLLFIIMKKCENKIKYLKYSY